MADRHRHDALRREAFQGRERVMNQRWEEGRSRWRSDRETIRPSEYEVAEISHDDARGFIETHHYSKDYPAARYRFGLHRHGTLVGVAVFSQPVNNRTVTKVFPIHQKEGVELGRLVDRKSTRLNSSHVSESRM